MLHLIYGGGEAILFYKTFIVHLWIQNWLFLRVVHKRIIQTYLKNADKSPLVLQKFASLINSLKEENNHGNNNVKNVIYQNK